MLQKLLAHTWHPLKGNYRPFASTFYNDGVSVKTWPQTNLAVISTNPLTFPFSLLDLTATQDEMMHHSTHWAVLVYTKQSLHIGGTARGKDWEFSKFSSQKSPNLSHSALQTHESLLPILLYCMLILWISWEPYLFWASREYLLGQLFLSLQSITSSPVSTVEVFFGKPFFSSGFSTDLGPSTKENTFKIEWGGSRMCSH